MMRAEVWPALGAVEVVRAHASLGPLGWHGNEHNDATGWYWFQATRRDVPDVRSEVFQHRKDAERDAALTFLNITGWRDGRTQNRIATT